MSKTEALRRLLKTALGDPDKLKPSPLIQRHFTCKELAELWHMSESTVFKMFVDEPGVIKIGERRTKVSIRVPIEVAERVYGKLRAGK